MEPPLLTLLADFTRLVVDHTGDRTTPREEEPRASQPIGEVLNLQIRHFIGATFARTRDEITTLIDGLDIPTRNISAQMDFRDLQIYTVLQEVMYQELLHPNNGVIHTTTRP